MTDTEAIMESNGSHITNPVEDPDALRILICEDEIVVATDIKICLDNFGYNVVGIASTGQEAVAMAEDFKPDIALMDIRLNGVISGIEVAKVFSDNFGIPVIYLSGIS